LALPESVPTRPMRSIARRMSWRLALFRPGKPTRGVLGRAGLSLSSKMTPATATTIQAAGIFAGTGIWNIVRKAITLMPKEGLSRSRICGQFNRDMGLRPMLKTLEKKRFSISVTTSTGRRPVSRWRVETEPVITDFHFTAISDAPLFRCARTSAGRRCYAMTRNRVSRNWPQAAFTSSPLVSRKWAVTFRLRRILRNVISRSRWGRV